MQVEWFRSTMVGLVLVAACAGGGVAEEPSSDGTDDGAASAGAESMSVFDMPRLQRQFAGAYAQLGRAFEQQQHERAEQMATRLIGVSPRSPALHYHLAAAVAQQPDRQQEAVEHLERAMDLGFTGVRQMAGDERLRPLHVLPEFRELVERMRDLAEPEPSAYHPIATVPAGVEQAAVADGVARIGEANTVWHLRQNVFRTFVAFDPPADAPAEPPLAPPVTTREGAAAELVNRWYEQGIAAGNHGDLYDNRDGGHSRLRSGDFPQVTHLRYGDGAAERNLARSPQVMFFFNHVTIGNCSMAQEHPVYWRSLPRLLMTEPRHMNVAGRQYLHNHLYVYPEHRDHEPEHGDLFPANTPYMIISQGSSGSDQPFLRAVALTLAAFEPETKRRLVQAGLLMPTVQKIFRRSNRRVGDGDDYLTGRAHPTVFQGDEVDAERMVRMAQQMRPDRVPPLARLGVEEETLGEPGVDYFAPAAREKLFDTPAAVARVFRSAEASKRLVVSAADSRDVNDHPLTYHWVVLRGDADRITITPREEDESVVEIDVPYHGRGRVDPRSDVSSHRVDIGLFVHNGHHYSAPAFVSIYFIPSERRRYEEGRIQRIDYADPVISRRYADPMLALPKDWADEYFYAGDGELLGWTRIRGDDRQRFTREGAVVIETDDRNRPTRARTVDYVAEPRGDDEPPQLVQQPGDTILEYSYEGPADPLGRVTAETPADD